MASLTELGPLLATFITSFCQISPHWASATSLVAAIYSISIVISKKQTNEIREFVLENKNLFTEAVLKDENFQKGFLRFFDTYIKTRVQKKKRFVKAIFLGFTVSDQKDKFALEKYLRTLDDMTLTTLEKLIWLDKTFSQVVQNRVDSKMKKYIDHGETDKRELERLKYVTAEGVEFSTIVNEWIHNNYNPNSQSVKDKYDYSESWTEFEKKNFNKERWLEEHELVKSLRPVWDELIQLGLIRQSSAFGGFGGPGGIVYLQTPFFREFVTFLKK